MSSGDVKVLLFDLGGVIIDLDRSQCVKALTEIGMKGAEELLGLYAQQGAFLLLETGKVSPAEFRDIIRKEIDGEVTDSQIDDAFNKFLIGLPIERLRLLRQLREKYKVYMLSNTNAIMFDSKIDELFRQDGLTVNDYFDGLGLSYESGYAKPEKEIFDYLLDKFNLQSADILFFDDSQKNLDAAAALGFKTYLVEPGMEFADAFNADLTIK